MAHVSKGVATEEEWGAGPAPTEAAEQADRPASAGDIRIDICGDLEQDQLLYRSLLRILKKSMYTCTLC